MLLFGAEVEQEVAAHIEQLMVDWRRQEAVLSLQPWPLPEAEELDNSVVVASFFPSK